MKKYPIEQPHPQPFPFLKGKGACFSRREGVREGFDIV
jgi:hypothetical protein